MDNLIKPIFLNSFGRFCASIGHLPASYDISLSYEEQLLWFCDFLKNEVIPALNNNSNAIVQLKKLYVDLKDYVDNYFDDLNIQTQINNKLDAMVEDGTLSEIINQEIFSSINTKLNKLTIYASELRSDYPNDNDLLQECVSGNYQKCIIDIDLDITTTISLHSNIEIENLATITADKTRLFYASNVENIYIHGGIFKTTDNISSSANSYQPIVLSCCKNVLIENCTINSETSDGLYIGIGYSELSTLQRTSDIIIRNCNFINCARNGIVINSGDNIIIDNCYFENILRFAPMHAIDIEFEYLSSHDWLYVNNLNIKNCYAKLCRSLCNIFNTQKMADNSLINIFDCTCDDCIIVAHGTSEFGCTVNIHNILFINNNGINSFRIYDWNSPNLLIIENISIDEYIGTPPSSNFEFGDFYIDSSSSLCGNIFITNIIYLSQNTRNQTIRLKGVTDIDVTVKNSFIFTAYSALLGFNVKLINCIGVINSNTKGYNGYFKVLELPDNIKLNFSIFSTSWLDFSIITGDNPSLTVSKDGNSYITKARIVLQNNKKYLELFTTRQYSFPFYYNLQDIPNGINKQLSTASSEDVLIEVDIV